MTDNNNDKEPDAAFVGASSFVICFIIIVSCQLYNYLITL